jgi:hypothetical protein
MVVVMMQIGEATSEDAAPLCLPLRPKKCMDLEENHDGGMGGCDRTTSEMRGLSPKIISEDS